MSYLTINLLKIQSLEMSCNFLAFDLVTACNLHCVIHLGSSTLFRMKIDPSSSCNLSWSYFLDLTVLIADRSPRTTLNSTYRSFHLRIWPSGEHILPLNEPTLDRSLTTLEIFAQQMPKCNQSTVSSLVRISIHRFVIGLLEFRNNERLVVQIAFKSDSTLNAFTVVFLTFIRIH